jgi:hypothetical protein
MKLISTAGGRFLVEEALAPLIANVTHDMATALRNGDDARYRAQRAILEGLLARHATRVNPGFVVPVTRRELLAVAS